MPHSRALSIVAASIAVTLGGTLFATVPRAATAVEAPEVSATATVSPTAPAETPVQPTATPTSVPTATPRPTATATPKPTATATPTPAPTPTPSTISFTYAGDSLTAMDASWMRQLKDPALTNVGGTAIGGATSTRILTRSSSHDADVLVVMAGTNDLRYGYSTKSILRNIDQITKKVGADHVVIAAIAPSNITNYSKKHIDRRKQGEILNRDLQNHALTRGWMFVDPWAADRQLNGGWPRSRTIDGVHPTVAMSKKVAVRMQQAIKIAYAGAAS